jgi:4'-phosphopantetheinyl transferase
MIKLYYSRIEDIKDQEIERYLNCMPFAWHYDIMRYKRVQDIKSRLLARLMLLQCLEYTNKTGSIVELKRTEGNKPYIENWYEFNISHSGSYVVFVYSDKQIGIDIEKKEKLRIA